MSQPTRRRRHERKRTHKRGSGITSSSPQTLPGISRKTDPQEIAKRLKAAKQAENAARLQLQEQVKPQDPKRKGGDPSAAVEDLEGGAKHEHAVTIVVDYSKDGKALTESEKKKLLKHIKTNHYYHGALKGKNSMKHEDTATHTRVSVLWKTGKLHKNGEDWDRVHELLTEELPHGIKAKHVHTE